MCPYHGEDIGFGGPWTNSSESASMETSQKHYSRERIIVDSSRLTISLRLVRIIWEFTLSMVSRFESIGREKWRKCRRFLVSSEYVHRKRRFVTFRCWTGAPSSSFEIRIFTETIGGSCFSYIVSRLDFLF